MTSTARKELKAKGFRVIQGEVGQEDLMENTSQQSAYTDQELVQRACRGRASPSHNSYPNITSEVFVSRTGCSEVERTPKTSFKKRFAVLTGSSQVFEGQASFYTWFYRIVVNLCIDETRKRKRSRLVDPR